jgi:DNA-binding HxlR family transcriptional regulator
MMSETTTKSDVVNKWGQEVAERGFVQLPNYLLLLNQFLDDEHRLSPTELIVLLQLVGGWWKKESMPFPAISTLARRCGVSDRQIQRALVRLEKLKLVERKARRGKRGLIASNAYDLTPLVSMLEQVAKAFPNEFPRKVTFEQRKAISAKLEDANSGFTVDEVTSPG